MTRGGTGALRTLMTRTPGLRVAILLGTMGSAVAQDAPLSWGPSVPVRPADAAAIRDVIAGQLDAFARDNRADAYAATAPNVRRKFPTPGAFGTMARTGYAPLFDVAGDRFTSVRAAAATATTAETWSQTVEIVTRTGQQWSAVYGLERQPDGSIAITSCVLIRRTGTSAWRVQPGPRLDRPGAGGRTGPDALA